MLLPRSGLLNAPYRDITEAAGMGLGTVAELSLERRGYLETTPPADPYRSVEIIEAFWKRPGADTAPDLVRPLLVYADLVVRSTRAISPSPGEFASDTSTMLSIAPDRPIRW